MSSSANTPKIYFRLDAGGLIGFGHLSRCLSIAQEFFKKGIEPHFIIRKRASLKNLDLPYPLHWLEEAEEVSSSEVTTWRAKSEDEEAREVLALLPSPSFIFVDHYGLQRSWQEKITGLGHKIILIQDQATNDFSAEVVINYNVNAEVFPYERGKSTHFLLGPRYIPLSSDYEGHHHLHWKSSAPLERIGVYLGGIKKEFITFFAEAWAGLPEFSQKKLEWVVNSAEEKALILEHLSESQVSIHVRLPHLLPLYERVQLFIGTCGVATFERASMGVWQLVFKMADNQSTMAQTIQENNLSFYGGDLRTLKKDQMILVMRETLKASPSTIKTKVENFFSLVDGRGAFHIADAIKARMEAY